jgi:F-type H+-transporting ATPase subunit delta
MTKVIVTTAVEPTSAQLEDIKKAAVKKYGKDVVIESKIDETILGGIQITIGSRQLDGSLKGKLDQIRKKFVQNS